ncbi:NACHT domain-containing protein, partial [Haliscomenobacter sp.]|uniref:NACHT domain-containing protein n=1 Tax=Haliscomenobacter sp. TaxID=2717303 RepID=UPI003364E8B0
MLNSIKTKEQLLLSVLITSLLAFIVGYIIGGWKIGGALSAICLLILLVAKNIWFSDKSNFLLRLSVVNIAVVVVGLTNSWLQPILLNLAKRFLPDLSIPDLNTSPVLYLFVLILVFIVFYFTQDRTVLGKEKETIIEIIQEPDFKDRFKMVCESLADDIRRVDKDTNWRGQYYTPLEAEVEFQDLNRRKKKIVKDLLAALKETKERLILVLGDPGAGKSVALRKLCLGLLTSKEVLKSYKIPIYINLKEWNSDREWTEDTPPTVDEIKGFVLENLKNRDIVTRDFFEDHFDKMYENGNLFFVFDSFDEIPAILGTSHDSLLIDEVSYVFTKFLKGARQPKAQGIIASREFRKPSDSFQSTLSLLIRPLSETNIISIFNRYGKINNEKVKELFRERPDLSNHARNPFTAALISEYIYRNQGSLPENLFLVYDSYVAGILNTSCREKMQRYKLQSDDIKNFMIDFGKVLFENSSLEIPINELRKQLSRHNFEEIVEILKFSRLCREGQGIDRVLSFSHRRFCEFFSVCNLLKEEKLNDKLMLDIPTDSLWRDTLVLYCMVAPRDKAIKIADFCWQIIDKSGSLLDQKSIHALRFLVDAFRGRKECIENFNKNLTKYILKNINKKNIFTTKFAVEALSLLDQDKIDEGTTHALSFGN